MRAFLVLAFLGAGLAGAADGEVSVALAQPSGTKYIAGKPMPVLCTFRNTSDSNRSFRLPFRPGGVRPEVPLLVSVRVRDADGLVITEGGDGWWTVHALNSQEYGEERRDWVRLCPAESREIRVDLSELLVGSSLLRGGLAPGTYQVQINSDAGRSNELQIEVEAPGE